MSKMKAPVTARNLREMLRQAIQPVKDDIDFSIYSGSYSAVLRDYGKMDRIASEISHGRKRGRARLRGAVRAAQESIMEHSNRGFVNDIMVTNGDGNREFYRGALGISSRFADFQQKYGILYLN